MDEQFISKVYRSITLTWVVAAAWALAFQKPWIGLSITLGMALGTAVLFTFERIITRAVVPGAVKAKRALLKLALVKYPLIGAVLYALVRWDRFSPVAFCGGILLVHFAIFAKYAGIKIMERRAADQTAASVQNREG